MNIRTKCLTVLASLAFLASALFDVRAEATCTEKTVEDRLAALENAFRKPDMQTKLSAAKKDWVEDSDFDNNDNAKYLGTVAAYHDMKRNYNAGAVDGACESLMRTDAMVRGVLSEQFDPEDGSPLAAATSPLPPMRTTSCSATPTTMQMSSERTGRLARSPR